MGRYTIGRGEGNDIVIEDGSVSRRHAKIEELGRGRYRIIDLQSANGCFVEQNARWQQFGEAEVTAKESLLIGDHQTTARDLIRRIAKPRQPGATVMAESEETRHGYPNTNSTAAKFKKDSACADFGPKPLSPLQKGTLIAAAAIVGLLIVGAVIIALLQGN